ncbi:MAG: DUF928 domain-containing protein [Cyanobacteria bacterium]|nr:DUF928 domain-containing protein [Cyanobacteriota bacterium]MDW8200634.1 DUF928 domain-containing protein [Cyanobacteriota bacterium SKYGB_h_bin112]
MTHRRLRGSLLNGFKVSTIALITLGWFLSSLAIAAPANRRFQVVFRPRAGEGAPQQTRGAATRGNCHADVGNDSLALTLLLPSANPSLQKQGSTVKAGLTVKEELTVSAHPTFLVYVPKTSAKIAEFTLATDVPERAVRAKEASQYTYTQRIALTGQPGIIAVTLPSDEPALALNTPYKWTFSLVCGDDRNRSADAYAEGTIRRVTLEADQQVRLARATDALEKAAIYGEAGIWYDLVATLAAAQRLSQGDAAVSDSWANLLNSTTVNLGSLAQASLVD